MCRLIILVLTLFVLIYKSARVGAYIIDIEDEWRRMISNIETWDKIAQWEEKIKANFEDLSMWRYMEGDILITEDGHQIKLPKTYRWPDGIIPYVISGKFNEDQRKRILDAMETFKNYTCVYFKQWENEQDYINITSDRSQCWSKIGKYGDEQKVNLEIPACVETHIIIHELMHAIGFYHEHSRKDRDKYVIINWDNIPKEERVNFCIVDNFDVPRPHESYDYNSIMHYSAYASAIDRNVKTISTKNPSNSPIGEAKTLSMVDVSKINRIYDCSKLVIIIHVLFANYETISKWFDKSEINAKLLEIFKYIRAMYGF